MEYTEQLPNTKTVDFAYRSLYKIGAAAALIAALIFRRNLDAEWMLLRMSGLIDTGPSAIPETVVDWFTLLQNNTLLGLTLLNLFDLINYVLVGLIFLGLLFAIRRTSQPWVGLAAVLAFAGITIYISSNQAFSMLSLSSQYTAANSDTQRAIILGAGEAVLAIHNNASFAGSGLYPSFLLVSTAGLIISVIMLQNRIFIRATAYMGILANGFGLGYYIVFAFAPEIVFIPLSISAIFLLVWYLMVGRRLWALGVDSKNQL